MRTRRALSRICSTDLLLLALLLFHAPAYAGPQVESSVSADPVSPDTPFTCSITVSWQGSADQYLIVPPQPELPENIRMVSSSFSSSSQKNLQRMHYDFVLSAAKEGSYEIKPVTIKYRARGEQQEDSVHSSATTFHALRFSFFRKSRAPLLMAGIAGLLVLLSGAMLFLRKKRRSAAAPQNNAAGPTASELLQCCRQSKLRGDYAGFFESAIALAGSCSKPAGISVEALAARLEKIRFGGFQPPAEEMERLLRQFEKAACAGTNKEPDYKKYCRFD